MLVEPEAILPIPTAECKKRCPNPRVPPEKTDTIDVQLDFYFPRVSHNVALWCLVGNSSSLADCCSPALIDLGVFMLSVDWFGFRPWVADLEVHSCLVSSCCGLGLALLLF
jgi:hypothetical protein